MAIKTSNERLAIMETKVIGMERQLGSVEIKIDSLIEKIDSNFVTKDEFAEYKKAQIWQKLLIGIGFMVIGALVTYFFTNIGKS